MRRVLWLVCFLLFASTAHAQIAGPALTFITDGNKVAATSRTVAVTATLSVTNLAVLSVSIDNLTATDGNTNDITSVTDAAGNTWVKGYEYTNGEGAAGAGVTNALFYSKITSQLTSGQNITVNYSGSVAAKPMKGVYFTTAAGLPIAMDGASGIAADATTSPGSITLTGAYTGQVICLRGLAGETNLTNHTAGAGWTKVNAAATSGSTADTNVMVGLEFSITTGTNCAASNPTTTTTADWASAAIRLYEQPATPTPTNTAAATDTPTPTPTDTPLPPTPTFTPTDTPVPPTATPTDTAVPPTATPTDTPIPPTATPTNTPTATATSTAIPTATFTPGSGGSRQRTMTGVGL